MCARRSCSRLRRLSSWAAVWSLGSGVCVEGVVRQVDAFLQERLRSATSDMANGEAQETILVSWNRRLASCPTAI